MRKKTLIIISLIVANFIVAQNEFYDAMTLKNLKYITVGKKIIFVPKDKRDTTKVDSTRLAEILGKYSNGTKTYAELQAQFEKNPFIKIPKIISQSSGDANKFDISRYTSGINSALSSVGGLDVTTIADGFAKFLVKRTKEELNIAFFSKFNEEIKKYPDIRSVFPQTYNTMSVIGDEIYNYQPYLQSLREAYEKDLSSLEEHLPSVIDNHPGFFEKNKDLEFILRNGCYLASELKNKAHPGDILANYPLQDLDALDPALKQNLKGAIQALQLFSESLRDSSRAENGNYWISEKQFNQLVADPHALKIYFGLIYQHCTLSPYNDIPFTNAISLRKMLDSLALHYDDLNSDLSKYKEYISGFSTRASQLNTMIKNNKKTATDSLAIEQYYNYVNSSIDFLQYCVKITKLPLLENLPLNTGKAELYFDVARSVANITVDVNRRNYAAAVMNAVHVFHVTIDSRMPSDDAIDAANKKIRKAKNQATADKLRNTPIEKSGLTAAEIIALKPAADTLYKAGFYNSEVFKTLFKLGTFMAAVAQAKTSDDVATAIETFALPSGSARIKRESRFNVALNGYVGLFTGYEKIDGVDKAGQGKINSFGVTAPIGISASIGKQRFFFKGGSHWSYSIFISVVDIGAITAFRFGDTTTAEVPTIQLKDIISPGAFFSIGIPKSPVSLNFGAQIGPNLRKVNAANASNTNPHNDYENKYYWRFSASLCVDIPFLNFYTKSK